MGRWGTFCSFGKTVIRMYHSYVCIYNTIIRKVRDSYVTSYLVNIIYNSKVEKEIVIYVRYIHINIIISCSLTRKVK